MKKYLIILLLTFICIPATGYTQPKEPTAEMIKELQDFKIKYLIQEMELPTDKQAEFSKIYTQYDRERNTLFHQLYLNSRATRKNTSPSDAEYLETAESMATAKAREGDLEQSYFRQFKTFLTPKQLYKMKCAEKKFDHKLKEMHKNKKVKKATAKKK